MKSDIELTVIVTAFNEEKNILRCLKLLCEFLEKNLNIFQIVFVDDGSSDKTFELLKQNVIDSRIQILKNNKNYGVGSSIKAALPLVHTEWFCWFPSDLEFLPEELLKPLNSCSNQEIVLTYAENSKEIRSYYRQLLSIFFTKILNISFKKDIKYFNGITLYKKKLIANHSIYSNRFFFHAELLLKCLNSTNAYVEVPITITPRAQGKSSAIKLAVLKDVIFCYLKSFWELRIKSDEYINN